MSQHSQHGIHCFQMLLVCLVPMCREICGLLFLALSSVHLGLPNGSAMTCVVSFIACLSIDAGIPPGAATLDAGAAVGPKKQ